MNEKDISWEEFFAMNLVGRDVEITSQTVTWRARINEVSLGYYFVDPGGNTHVANFIKQEDAVWKPLNFISHSIREMKWKDRALPKMKDDGTITYVFYNKFITIHKEGDNMLFT